MCTEETRTKLKARVYSEELRAKMSKGQTGKKLSEEQKSEIREKLDMIDQMVLTIRSELDV